MEDLNKLMYPWSKEKREILSDIYIRNTLKYLVEENEKLKEQINNIKPSSDISQKKFSTRIDKDNSLRLQESSDDIYLNEEQSKIVYDACNYYYENVNNIVGIVGRCVIKDMNIQGEVDIPLIDILSPNVFVQKYQNIIVDEVSDIKITIFQIMTRLMYMDMSMDAGFLIQTFDKPIDILPANTPIGMFMIVQNNSRIQGAFVNEIYEYLMSGTDMELTFYVKNEVNEND